MYRFDGIRERVPKPEPPVTFKKHMINGFLRCSTSCTNCIPLYSSCSYFLLSRYTSCRYQLRKDFSGETERPYSGSVLSLFGYIRSTWYPDLTVYVPILVKCIHHDLLFEFDLMVYFQLFSYLEDPPDSEWPVNYMFSMLHWWDNLLYSPGKDCVNFYLMVSAEWMRAKDHFILR